MLAFVRYALPLTLLTAPLKVELTQGDTESLVLEGEPEALANIETVVENGILMIRSRSKFNFGRTPKMRAYVTAKNIESLRISGSGDISTPSLRSNALKSGISGSGDIRIGTLAVASLDVAVSGSGDVAGAGSVRRVGLSPS